MQLAGFVSELFGGPKWIAVAAQVGFAIGLAPIGIRVLRQSDESWQTDSLEQLSLPSDEAPQGRLCVPERGARKEAARPGRRVTRTRRLCCSDYRHTVPPPLHE